MKRSGWLACCIAVIGLTLVGLPLFSRAALAAPVLPSWTRHGLKQVSVSRILPDPSDPSIAYADTAGDGVYKTTDEGQLWTPLPQPVPDSFGVVAVIAGDPSKVIATGSRSQYGPRLLFKSSDGGNTWILVSRAFPPEVEQVLFDPLDAHVAWAASRVALFKSTDGGRTWAAIDFGVSNPYGIDISMDPSHPATVFVATPSGIYRTRRGGTHWRRVWQDRWTSDVEVDPAESNVVLANTGAGILRSSDGGDTWTNVSIGSGYSYVGGIRFAGTSNEVFAEAGRSVYVSTDAGATWHVFQRTFGVGEMGSGPTGSPIYIVAEHSRAPSIAVSDDGGNTWHRSWRGFDSSYVTRLVTSASDPSLVFASYPYSISTNDGLSWHPVPDPSVLPLAVDPTDASVVYGSGVDALYRSDDEGKSWTRLSGSSYGAAAVLVDPQDPQRLYVQGWGGEIYRSDDGGRTLAPIFGLGRQKVEQIALDPLDADRVFAAGNRGGLYGSTDGGATWTLLRGQHALAVGVVPGTQTLLVGTATHGVFVSHDGGATWSHVRGIDGRGGIWGGREGVTSIVVDPADPSTVFVSVLGNGVYRSDDGGQTWTPWSQGLRSVLVKALAIGGNGTTLHAATYGAGVWETPI